MNIYTPEMLKSKPSVEHIIDEISQRVVMTKDPETGIEASYRVGCGALAFVNTLLYYRANYLRTPTLFDMINEAHFILEESVEGGLMVNKLLNVLYNEGFEPHFICYPREMDFLQAVADPERIGLLISNFGLDTHIQTIRQSPRGRFLYGSVELDLTQIMALSNKRQPYKSENGKIHYNPSVLIKLRARKKGH